MLPLPHANMIMSLLYLETLTKKFFLKGEFPDVLMVSIWALSLLHLKFNPWSGNWDGNQAAVSHDQKTNKQTNKQKKPT